MNQETKSSTNGFVSFTDETRSGSMVSVWVGDLEESYSEFSV